LWDWNLNAFDCTKLSVLFVFSVGLLFNMTSIEKSIKWMHSGTN
jgi:hypothetical protein